MPVLGTSLVGVLISASPGYFCLPVFCLLCPPPPSISNSAWFSISYVRLSLGGRGVSVSDFLISFHLPFCFNFLVSVHLSLRLSLPPYFCHSVLFLLSDSRSL